MRRGATVARGQRNAGQKRRTEELGVARLCGRTGRGTGDDTNALAGRRRSVCRADERVVIGSESSAGVAERSGKGALVNLFEPATAVVQKDRDRFAKGGGGEDKINGVVAIDVARQDLQAPGWGYDSDGLAAAGSQLKPNRVNALARVGTGDFDAGQVGMQVSVKISDGERWAGCF